MRWLHQRCLSSALKAHACLQVHVEEGALVCPESGHRFPIRCVPRRPHAALQHAQNTSMHLSRAALFCPRSEGIPNMLLAEDELPTK